MTKPYASRVSALFAVCGTNPARALCRVGHAAALF